MVQAQGWTLYYGDAEAHLNIARRIVDSQTPGYDQTGTVWLSLPHWIMLPVVGRDDWWRSGMAGAIPSALCFVAAAALLAASVRRVLGSEAAAMAGAALFAFNPNVLYLQSIPMSEAVFWAAFMALLYCTVRGWVAGAGLAGIVASLSRYDGWFLLPFVALYFLLTAKRGVAAALSFSALAALGPVYWVGHNWWLSGHPLDFYNGPYSAHAIQHGMPYPGYGDWHVSWRYFRTAAVLCAGPVLPLVGLAGLPAAWAKRAMWPTALLALPCAFYVWSLHSSGTPIHLPTLPPFSYYNSRYGLAAMPLFAFTGAALVAVTPAGKLRAVVAALMVFAATVPWAWNPVITWQESRVNSEARRQWTRQAAHYLATRYVRGSGIITSFGDITGVFREAGIPLRETFTGDNGLPWDAAMARPCLWLWQEWAVAQQGDAVDRAVENQPGCAQYRLDKSIVVEGAAPLKIYRRIGGTHGSS